MQRLFLNFCLAKLLVNFAFVCPALGDVLPELNAFSFYAGPPFIEETLGSGDVGESEKLIERLTRKLLQQQGLPESVIVALWRGIEKSYGPSVPQVRNFSVKGHETARALDPIRKSALNLILDAKGVNDLNTIAFLFRIIELDRRCMGSALSVFAVDKIASSKVLSVTELTGLATLFEADPRVRVKFSVIGSVPQLVDRYPESLKMFVRTVLPYVVTNFPLNRQENMLRDRAHHALLQISRRKEAEFEKVAAELADKGYGEFVQEFYRLTQRASPPGPHFDCGGDIAGQS